MLPSKFILLTYFLIQFALVNKTWVVNMSRNSIILLWNISQGISYLLYPLWGWLADTYTTSFKVIVASFIVGVAGSTVAVITAVYSYYFYNSESSSTSFTFFLYLGFTVVVGLIGLGMYEANAIQFGMDQMTEASSEQLSSFIHWYYWCAHLAPALYYYSVVGGYLCVRNCVIKEPWSNLYRLSIAGFIILPSAVQFILLICCLLLTAYFKRHLHTAQPKKNYFKLIFGVVQYSFKHKYPVMRSAFTYWENYTPARLDLGKQKYGGPYSTEEVEDVKTFMRLLLLIFSLFGFQLTGDGYSLVQYVMKTVGCPTVGTMVTLLMNPSHLRVMITLISVPLYQFILKHKIECYLPNLLNRIGIGVFFCLLSQFSNLLISIYISVTENMVLREFSCAKASFQSSTLLKCLSANMKLSSINGTCENICKNLQPRYDTAFILPVIPITLNAVGQILVFLTALEFICAQAPKDVKGLLIGIFYSQLSLKNGIINSLDQTDYFQQNTNWELYNGTKGIGIFISIVAFSLVSKWYHYRERDEIVNEQAIIEELYERELLLDQSDDDNSQYTFSD